MIRICCFIAAVSTLITSTNLFAQETEKAGASGSAQSLQRAIHERDEVIQQLLKRIEQLERRVEKIEGLPSQRLQAKPSNRETAPTTAGGDIARERKENEPKTSAKDGTAPKRGELDKREKERLLSAAFEQRLIERGGLLLPAGTYDLEPSISYVHSSADHILIDGFTLLPVLIVGDIVSQRIQRDQTVAVMTGRLGLPWDSQIEVSVPYIYQTAKTYSADNSQEIVSDSGLGDIEVALSHQLYKSQGEWPDLLTTLRWKSKTGKSSFALDPTDLVLGTGYNALGLSFTGVKVVDPVVYFGGINYIYKFSTTENIGRFKPGDSFGFNLGMAIALNLSSSLSVSYDQLFTGRSALNGNLIPGSYLTTGLFTVGSSYSLAPDLTVDASIGIGVTSDSPDFLFRMAFPIRGKF